MLYPWSLVQAFVTRREEGQGLVEYALILSLVAILIMAALMALGDQISTTFSTIVSGLATAN